jgi:hypothetical protein
LRGERSSKCNNKRHNKKFVPRRLHAVLLRTLPIALHRTFTAGSTQG